ncbi:ABC transporter substrate-binding protein [Anaerocolumna sp. AGMB13020]|uniref:ABC transporter substrate-binding protein n=1 Tax=Anaerocolumna sp. AGMB13020 TaxID=3081750 RepID=UPI002954E390|nr:ABC transporter substrate-binding protein [Anaerocolumna sp. AGMB13020]WOO38888.1 ABC transporter substrate-binding protein [Anaerocolumna sp. AGMB13020]
MKKLMPLILSLTIVLTLSACAKSQTEVPTESQVTEEPDTTAEAEMSTESSEESGTRTVHTVMGDIEIPVNPQRVVVNWYIGETLAAGLNVVGYNGWMQKTMPFYDQLMAITKIENWEQEEVMALEPDLIITYSKEDYDTFSQVAPVLVIEESTLSPERTRIIGEATGTLETAEKTITTFETKLKNAKEIFKKEAFNGKTFSILEDWGSSGEWAGLSYETGSRGGTLLYTYLEQQYPDKLRELIETTGNGRGTISYEVAHEYFGDYIIWCRQEGIESEYAQSDIWKSIPAVAEGHVLEIPGEYQGLFYYDDVLSLDAQLDYLVEALNTLVD